MTRDAAFARHFDRLYAHDTASRAQVRIGGVVVERALYGRSEAQSSSADDGLGLTRVGSVRFWAGDVPPMTLRALQPGSLFDLKRSGDEAWTQVRAGVPSLQGGVVSVAVEGVHDAG